jgi:hypothetical protein
VQGFVERDSKSLLFSQNRRRGSQSAKPIMTVLASKCLAFEQSFVMNIHELSCIVLKLG